MTDAPVEPDPLPGAADQAIRTLGSFWAQDAFATSRGQAVAESPRLRRIARLGRLLGSTRRGRMLLIVFAGMIYVGRWFAGRARKDVYLVSLTAKNDEALQRLTPVIDERLGLDARINRERPAPPARLRALLDRRALRVVADSLGRWRAPDEATFAHQVVGAAAFLLFCADLRRARPRLFAVANDHTPAAVGALAAARLEGAPSVYVQHAPVTALFPPLSADLAVLDSPHSVDCYKEAATRSGLRPPSEDRFAYLPIGAPEIEPMRLPTGRIRVGVALPLYPDAAELAALVDRLCALEVVSEVLLKPHPRSLFDFTERLWPDRAHVLNASFGPQDWAARFDVCVTGNSGVALEFLRLGRPVLLHDALDASERDYYGFLKEGLTPEFSEELLIDPAALAAAFDSAWSDRLRRFGPPEERSVDDMEAALAARLRSMVSGVEAPPPRASLAPRDSDISVVIPTFNRRDALPAAIASVRAQTAPAAEIIVVDDGSTDGTSAYLAAEHPDVKVVRVFSGRGAAAARNLGVEAATGRYVAFLDSDDVFMPEKLELQMALMALRGARYSTTAYVSGSGAVFKARGGSLRTLLRRNCWGGTSGLMAETEVLRACPFDPAMKAAQDWELFLRLARFGPSAHVGRPLYRYEDKAADRITRSKRRRFIGHAQLRRRHMRTAPRAGARARMAHWATLKMLYADYAEDRTALAIWRAAHRLLS